MPGAETQPPSENHGRSSFDITRLTTITRPAATKPDPNPKPTNAALSIPKVRHQ